MAQLNFHQEYYITPTIITGISDGTLSFVPLNIRDSVSLNTVNMWISFSSAAQTHTFNIGLYSLTGSTLSIANSISGTISASNNQRRYISFTATSATQNITPGTWWFGLLIRTSGNANISLDAANIINAQNAFPGAFTGGRMSVSTNAIPASIATSDLDITGSDATALRPIIIISA